MQSYSILAVEGPHDQAAVTKVLELSGFVRFNGDAKQLDPFWDGFKPTYPKRGNLYTRLDMPTILTSQTHSIAIYWGEGSNLVKNVVAIAMNHERYSKDIQAFGLIVDADDHKPEEIAKVNAMSLRSIFPTISDIPGLVTPGSPQTGIYVLPDNVRTGVLDSMLINCASVVYPEHKDAATQYMNSLHMDHTKHLNSFRKEKALIAAIVSVLRPGATNTASIAQDKWINKETISGIRDVANLHKFLKDLLNLD